MRKLLKAHHALRSFALSENQLKSLKGGSLKKDIQKYEKALSKYQEKGDMKDLMKSIDKLACQGYYVDFCCGNGNGTW